MFSVSTLDMKYDLNYIELGDPKNKTLVFLHGLGGTLRYWNTGMEKLSKDFHIIQIDLLGFGDSPQPLKNYTTQKHLLALHSVLKTKGSFILIGHSLGAMLSIAYTNEYPNKVMGIVLISLPVFDNKKYAYKWMRKTPSGWLMTNIVIAAVTCVLTRYVAGKLFPYFLKEYPQEVLEDLVKHNFLSSTTSLWNIIYQQSIYKLLKHINQESFVHLIHSENDVTAPIKAIENLVNTNKLLTLTKLKTSAHHPWLWDNETCINIIKSRLKKIEN